MTLRSMNRAVLLLILAFAAAACGSATAPPAGGTAAPGGTAALGASGAPPAIAPACDLLSDEELATITGATVVSKDDNVADTVYANHCRWTLQRPDGGNGTVDLGILSPEGRQRYDVTSEQTAFEPFEGLPADDAGGDPESATIYAVRGDTLVDVYALGLGLSREATGELARAVLQRLFGASGPGGTAGTGAQPTAPAANGGSVSDACTLLADAEILEVTGAAARSDTGGPRFGMWNVGCIWELEGEGLLPATVELLIKSPGGRASWDQYMVPIQGEFTAVAGLGDAAFEKVLWPTHVISGDTYFSVQVKNLPNSEAPFATELARRVAAHLRR
jgi:hypothetical protein